MLIADREPRASGASTRTRRDRRNHRIGAQRKTASRRMGVSQGSPSRAPRPDDRRPHHHYRGLHDSPRGRGEREHHASRGHLGLARCILGDGQAATVRLDSRRRRPDGRHPHRRPQQSQIRASAPRHDPSTPVAGGGNPGYTGDNIPSGAPWRSSTPLVRPPHPRRRLHV
jgi:hypothetical protein